MSLFRRAFTLIELMVVVGIIIVLTALSIPAIGKFLEGQSLSQSGRILQAAFNEARRAAITQRTNQYLIFFREADPARPGEFKYGIARYRERYGYEGQAQLLMPGVMFDMPTAGGSKAKTTLSDLIAGEVRGLRLPVFEGLPPEADKPCFTSGRVPIAPTGKKTDDRRWLLFARDGSIKIVGQDFDQPPVIYEGGDILDGSHAFDRPQAVFDKWPDQVDMNLIETGLGDAVDKRCFIDLDKHAGRIRIRVLTATN